MQVKKLIEKLNFSLEKNLKEDNIASNAEVSKYVKKALSMLNSDKKEDLLKELVKEKNAHISLKIRENHLMRS